MALLYSEYIYNEFVNNSKSTNLIYIDADKYDTYNSKDKKIILLEEIINLTSQPMQAQKNIDIFKAGVKSVFSYFTEPLIRNFIDNYVDMGIDQITALLSDSIKDTIESISKGLNYNFTDEVLNKITDEVNKTLNTSNSSILEKLLSKKLNLSKEAKKKLNNFLFKENFTPIEIFSLVIELLISIATNDEENESNNKLIFINNPHKLDENSLSVFSFLFSFAKDLKEKNKNIGISVVYCYSDDNFQPYQDLKNNKYKISKKLLDEQRRFTQRYSMLERPSSDIPNIAVKSSTFVGREEELQILKERFEESKNSRNFKNIQIIKAEPGIGKTKLIKKHIEQIKLEKNGNRIIQLTILNHVGHCSSNTGLSSLRNSVLKEAKRLETLKELEEIVVDKIKNILKTNVISYIEDLVGVNNILEIGKSIKDAYNLKKDTDVLLEQSIKDINSKDKKTKEQQFKDIIEAILELKTIAYEGKTFKPFPIILFIDDIQWIDEDSCEFILEYLAKQEIIDIYIIASQRLSDATTELELAKENISLNPYKISLLQQIEIYTDKTIEYPDVLTNLSVLKPINLNGIDEKNLTDLISITIEPENKTEDKKQKDIILAKFIIKNLINKSSGCKDYVNTLFAIETINLLCDENLYNSKDKDGNKIFKSIDCLILQNPLRYNDQFNDKSIENFTKILENTFKVLNNKYTEAFEHINSDNKFEKQFNLMSYSVFEERLHILKQYFKEYGDAAVNTLFFSSLLGAPFNSEIVKNVLIALSITEDSLLKPLKEYVKKSNQCNLKQNHYEIIEEVYEILSRYVHFDSIYSYRHNILELFLNKQLEYILDSKLQKYNIIEAKDKLFELIIDIIEKEEIKKDFTNKYMHSLTFLEYEELIIFNLIKLKVLKHAYDNKKDKWIILYSDFLEKVSILFNYNMSNSKAIEYMKESVDVLKGTIENVEINSLYYYKKSILNEIIYNKGLYSLNAFNDIKNAYNLIMSSQNLSAIFKSYEKIINRYINFLIIHNSEEAIKVLNSFQKIFLITNESEFSKNKRVINYLALKFKITKNLKDWEDRKKYIEELYEANPPEWTSEYIAVLNDFLNLDHSFIIQDETGKNLFKNASNNIIGNVKGIVIDSKRNYDLELCSFLYNISNRYYRLELYDEALEWLLDGFTKAKKNYFSQKITLWETFSWRYIVLIVEVYKVKGFFDKGITIVNSFIKEIDNSNSKNTKIKEGLLTLRIDLIKNYENKSKIELLVDILNHDKIFIPDTIDKKNINDIVELLRENIFDFCNTFDCYCDIEKVNTNKNIIDILQKIDKDFMIKYLTEDINFNYNSFVDYLISVYYEN